jgi:sugar phosphate isomerase/epimerase
MSDHPHNYPKLHNAAWPGLVGKGNGGEPPIGLDTMLDLTAAAEVDGVRFDGFDIFLYHPHFDIDGGEEEVKRLADKARARNLQVGSVVAPVYPGTGGGLPMGDKTEQQKFLGQVHKACHVGRQLRHLGVRPNGVVRFDSAGGVAAWCEDPKGNQARIADTFREACKIAEDHGERLAAEGEICWGGMHSWRRMIELLEMVDRPQTLGFQADMSHTLLFLMGYNAPEDALLPEDFDWNDQDRFYEAYEKLTAALRPWTIDFHVAQNDGTVHGSGSHDKTGRHCLATDPNGKLDIVRSAGYWLRDANRQLTKAFRHICWDGCMFPNATMMKRQTWNDILRAMVAVRDAHGWKE